MIPLKLPYLGSGDVTDERGRRQTPNLSFSSQFFGIFTEEPQNTCGMDFSNTDIASSNCLPATGKHLSQKFVTCTIRELLNAK